MRYLVPIISSIGGGVLVGGAYAAFVTMLGIMSRLIQVSKTKRYLKFYEGLFITSSLAFTLLYFFDSNFHLSSIFTLIFGLFSGIFLGLLSSALAEVLNVLPIISKKFKIKKSMKIVFFALLLGKISGAIYYFLFIVSK